MTVGRVVQSDGGEMVRMWGWVGDWWGGDTAGSAAWPMVQMWEWWEG